MQALTITSLGDPPGLAQRGAPQPGPGEALLDVVAAPLNPVDLRIASGGFFMGHPPLPYTPGVELVGRVRHSARWPAGTLGWASLDGLGTSRDGCLAEQVVVRDELLVPIDTQVDTALAAALGTPGLAAWIPLTRRAPVKHGERALVLGATGTVGLVAVQAAKILGARWVVAVGRSAVRLQRTRDFGADATVLLSEVRAHDLDRLVADLRDAFGPDGPTLVFDPLWGDPLVAALHVAAPAARVIHLGQSANPTASVPSTLLRGKNIDLLGYSNFNVEQETLREAYTELLAQAAAGRIAFPLEKVALAESQEAWQRLAAGDGTKLVVCP